MTPVRLSGCSGTGKGITGSSGSELFNTPGPGTSQVTWKKGPVILDEDLTFNYNASHTCAPMTGYKYVSAVKITGAVGGGTGSASQLNGGKVVEHFCQYTTHNLTNYLFVGYGTQQE